MENSEGIADSIGRIEIELLKLVRHLETFGRRSDLYVQVDRAGYLALRTIDESGSMNVNALSKMLHLDASTVTRQVAAMQTDGLIDRRPDPTDLRSSVVALTVIGRRVMRSVERKRRHQFDTLTKGWSRKDRDSFGHLTAMLNASLIDLDNSLHEVHRRSSSTRQANQ